MNAKEFKEKYYPFHPKLYRIAYILLKNTEDAEDIIQDAYCKLWNKRAELNQIAQPEAFCVTMVKNLCLDFLRSPRNKMDESPDHFVNLAYTKTPEHELESKERVEQIHKLIDQLPEKQQIVIKMKECGEYTMEEIEAVTGESAVHIRVLLSRGRKKLKDMLVQII